ncbi:MAG: hypothetical protein JWQ81_5253 [Amycolatopsis sp.]|uniref:DUF3558 domain-containing protein n=1 Tax=Amycolatopsis sp. TaxID=37632 RepID=UPI0026229802|nr:DUF3558 domain-containing protein [Amycolatopsis sp.]MCU1684514.1 hypothetical protein [Amycolatopsis sp.]
MSTTTRRWAAAALVVGLLAVAGCHQTITPSALPPTTTVVPSPPIPSPLNGAKFTAAPCSAITAAQLTSIGFTRVSAPAAGSTGECIVNLDQSRITIFWDPSVQDHSLNHFYYYHSRGFDTGNHWEEATVDGYPGVIINIQTGKDGSLAGEPLACTLVLGIDTTTTVVIQPDISDDPTAGPWQHDPCGAAKKIAGLAIGNLRP